MTRETCRVGVRGWLVGLAAGVVSAAPAATIAAGASTAPGPGPTSEAVTQPAPAISATAFHVEPRGSIPRDGDGLIPNSATPAGSTPGAVKPCDRTVEAASAGPTTLNALIRSKENSISRRYVICLSGTFTEPVDVWSKYSSALLVIEAEPGSTATVKPGRVRASQVNPNDHDGGIVGAVDLTDSRDVEIEGLTITDYWADGPDYAPAGILATTRQSTVTAQSKVPHESACYVRSADHSCGGIYLIDDTISWIVNRGDEPSDVRSLCNNPNVGAFGIAVLSYGHDEAHALQHVVIEGDTVDHTRTGESETVTVNGDVQDFLLDDNRVYDTDNIGMDAIGWEEGTDQARDGLIEDNTVANVDTYGNYSYGSWKNGSCRNLPENAAGIYDDGASYVWIDHNTVQNTDQGIDADVETPARWTDHILVTRNVVVDQTGTSLGLPSSGTNPPGIPGSSKVAGHAYDAFYVDSFGTGSHIEDVYAHDNSFENESRYYGATSPQDAPVIDLSGTFEHVMLWDNTVTGGGASDRWNPLLELDNLPVKSAPDVIDCTRYAALTTLDTGEANFATPSNSYLSLRTWQRRNGYGFDAHSSTRTTTSCSAARA